MVAACGCGACCRWRRGRTRFQGRQWQRAARRRQRHRDQVKGSSLVVKGGTKVKNIRLVEGDHDIDCRIDGVGAMQLKSEFVRKA
jgi:hypothetical protein